MKRYLDWLTATTERRIALALLGLCVMLYIPLAGNYGMWDPWETHYGEIARQMLERNDWVSLWWPGSPQDRMEVFHKPVLHFWLMALSMKLFGLEWAGARASEIADSWRVEWACRLPNILLSIAAIFAVWSLVRRLAGRRAGALSAVVLATSSQWVFITRQAMTDLPFVAPMTIALCLGGLALLLPESERESELPRRSVKIGRFAVSWPHARAFYAFAALFILTTLPQLIVISIQLRVALRLGSSNLHLIGLVPMLPYIAAFLVGLWWCARATNKRQLYLFSAYVLCALATLAKGPAGVLLPGIVLVLYLILSGRWREIFTRLEILRGPLLFAATAVPWYHAMLIRHGWAFWNEFIGDNYVHRAGGRHGDRGTFEYYVQWAGYGMFPWSGIATVAGLLSFKQLRSASPKRGLVAFAILWFVVEFSVMSLVNTKFHHYILPALPALAILVGLFLDEVLTAPKRIHALALILIATPVTFLCGRDLAAFPPRLLWLFNYDYVNMPGTGRPWPTTALYGQRYEYGDQLFVFAIVATAATLAIAIFAWIGRRGGAALFGSPGGSAPAVGAPPAAGSTSSEAPSSNDEAIVAIEARAPLPLGLIALALAGFVGALALAISFGPASPKGAAPVISPWAWIPPAAMMLPFLALFALTLRGSIASRARAATVWALALVAVVWSAFLVDKLLIELSPHWSQKHVLASYYQNRKSENEPLIAWQLYWRGENFYTKNEIYKSANPNERTVFLGDHNAEKMQKYFTDHPGRRVFFVVERIRFESLRQLLPPAARPTLTIVDETNNKIYLAVATLPGGETQVAPRP